MPEYKHKHGGGRSPNPYVGAGIPANPQAANTADPYIEKQPTPKVALDFTQKEHTKKLDLTAAEKGTA